MKKRKEKPRLITMKAHDWDADQLQRKADKHARGNLSAWLRYAGRMYNPKPGERINLKAS